MHSKKKRNSISRFFFYFLHTIAIGETDHFFTSRGHVSKMFVSLFLYFLYSPFSPNHGQIYDSSVGRITKI